MSDTYLVLSSVNNYFGMPVATVTLVEIKRQIARSTAPHEFAMLLYHVPDDVYQALIDEFHIPPKARPQNRVDDPNERRWRLLLVEDYTLEQRFDAFGG